MARRRWRRTAVVRHSDAQPQHTATATRSGDGRVCNNDNVVGGSCWRFAPAPVLFFNMSTGCGQFVTTVSGRKQKYNYKFAVFLLYSDRLATVYFSYKNYCK